MRENDNGEGHFQLKDIEVLLEGSPSCIEEEIAAQMSTYTGWAGIEDHCRNGGTAFDVEVDVTLDPYDADSEEITGSFTLSFQERYRSPCRDKEWSADYEGKGKLTLDPSTGDVRLESEVEQVLSAADRADRDEWLAERAQRELSEEPKDTPEPF